MQLIFVRSYVTLCTIMVLTCMGIVAAHPVLAEPGNGARIIDFVDCIDADGHAICYAAKGLVNETSTPSGNVSFTGHLRSDFTVTDPQGTIVFEISGESHFHRLTKDGMLEVLSDHAEETVSGGGMTCTMKYAVHYANGEIVFSRSERTCD
jgi:hypothetical protein